MSDQDAFERILAAFYDTMLNEALWPATSALIDEACGMQGSALAVVARPPAISSSSGSTTGASATPPWSVTIATSTNISTKASRATAPCPTATWCTPPPCTPPES